MSNPSAAKASYGATFAIGNLANGSSSQWTAVAEVVSIGDPEQNITMIEVSNLTSPNAYKEFVAGMVNGGSVDLALNYTKGNKAALTALVRTKQDFQITFPDQTTTSNNNSVLVCPALLEKFGGEIPADGKISSKATFKLTGQPVFTAGT